MTKFSPDVVEGQVPVKVLTTSDLFPEESPETADYALLGEAVLRAFNGTSAIHDTTTTVNPEFLWDETVRDRPMTLPADIAERLTIPGRRTSSPLDLQFLHILGSEVFNLAVIKLVNVIQLDGTIHLPVSRGHIANVIEKAKGRLHKTNYPSDNPAETRRRLYDDALPNISDVLTHFFERDQELQKVLPLGFLHELANRATKVLLAVNQSSNLFNRIAHPDLSNRYGLVGGLFSSLSREQLVAVQARALHQLKNIQVVTAGFEGKGEFFKPNGVFKTPHDCVSFFQHYNDRLADWKEEYELNHTSAPIRLIQNYLHSSETANFFERFFAPDKLLSTFEQGRLYGGLENFARFVVNQEGKKVPHKDFVLAAVAMGYDSSVAFIMYGYAQEHKDAYIIAPKRHYELILRLARTRRGYNEKLGLSVNNPKDWDRLFPDQDLGATFR